MNRKSVTLARTFVFSLYFLSLFTGIPTVLAAAGANIPAPEFPPDLPWLNVSRPLTLADLRGRVVILDFWTYGCINCIHVAEELKRLEEKFGENLLVIGVHSPKFDNERRLSTLRSMTLRYDRRHPIVNDIGRSMMHLYRARAWPTLVVLDPLGGVEGYVTGEGHEQLLAATVERLLKETKDKPSPHPLPMALERDQVAASFLAAPGKIAVHGDKVAISDTLHHRLVVADTDGQVLQIIGDGQAGMRDGPVNQARFHAPQGLVFAGDQLYVADTGNHALRRVDLSAGKVIRVAGTGQLGDLVSGEFDALEVALRSPWDLAWDGTFLYVAMAGSHQIWRYRPHLGRIGIWAGTRIEGIDDGGVKKATFSQPSGLTIDGKSLYVADPEASAVRVIDLADEAVTTLIGRGLFEFGDRDGSLAQALLQHPLGVASTREGRIVIADTYNHKLKIVDPKAGTITTLAGSGQPAEEADGDIALNEPGGVAVINQQVLVTDTNNNRIVVYDLKRKTTEVWPLHLSPEGPAAGTKAAKDLDDPDR